jgi:Leucine-rich repeat (LRR) protein
MKLTHDSRVAFWKLTVFWIVGACVLIGMFAVLLLPPVGASRFKFSISAAMESPQSVTRLALMNTELDKFPDEIKQFPNLEVLRLTGNKAAEVPDWIGREQKLKDLRLKQFKLDPFPEALTQLVTLDDVELGDCLISNLPPTIGKLQALEFLDLRNNKLTDVPDEISQLTSLKVLRVGGNPLKPAVLERIRKLLPNSKVESENE